MSLKPKPKKKQRDGSDNNPADNPGELENLEAALPKQALMAHLKALRNVLIISAIAIGVAFIGIFLGFSEQLMDYLKAPMSAQGVQLVYIALSESVVMKMKISFIAGVIVASPVVFWQIWSFLKPALYPHEGRIVIGLFSLTVLLFLLGSIFAYFIVFRMAITFFLLNSEGVAMPFISIEKYVEFLVSFVLPFGLMFELPIVMCLLTRSGILTIRACTKSRKYVIFAIFVVAAILTPPDVVSQVLLALPLIVLFEVGILASRILQKRSEKRQALVE